MAIPTELLVQITNRLAPDGGPATVQDALGVWATLFGKLGPLFGPLSNELLFARSMTRRQPGFPWLPRLEPGAESSAFAGFVPSLHGRSPEEIVAVTRALLDTYTAALADLIGAYLATRLLRAAFPDTDS